MTHHLDRKNLTCVAQNIAGKVHKKTRLKMLGKKKTLLNNNTCYVQILIWLRYRELLYPLALL